MDLIQLVENSPLWLSMTVMFVAALAEYVFPPFPGDTLLVVGGFFVAQGVFPLVLTFIILTIGSVTGCAVGWAIGKHGLGLKKLITKEYLEKVEDSYERYGVWLLISNRFMPGIRGAFMIAAGLINVPLKPILFWGMISALLWNSLLIGLGYIFSDSLEFLLEILKAYSRTALVLVGFALVIWFMTKKVRLRSYNHRQAQIPSQETETNQQN